MNDDTAITHHPPHGGYPTPRYEEAPMARRLCSQRVFGHSGAACYRTVIVTMALAAVGRTQPRHD